MRAIAKWPSTLLIVGAIALTSGCASEGHRPVFDGGYPEYDCPEHLQGRLSVSIDVRPNEVDAARIKDYAIDTVGIVDRRLMISIAPAGLRPDDGIVWHSLSISSYGGTFVAWSRLQTDQLTLTPAATPVVQKEARTKQARGEVALVSLGAGVVTIERSIREQGDLLGTFALDLSIMPGGVVVGDYELGIFRQSTARIGRPYGPLDADAIASLRALTAEDIALLEVGAVGEP